MILSYTFLNIITRTHQLCNALLWYTMEYSTSHLYFLDIHTSLYASAYNKKIQVASEITHGIPQENVT